MRFGSVCSGIEAASVAWRPLGWEAAWLSEIEPFPCAVLAHHYPSVPNLGDMTALAERITSGEIEAPDLFCGGTPCQAFSVAGLRKSLDDARGNLSLVFCEIANAIDTARLSAGSEPAIVFWENVPGVLNTKDNAFGCFLAGLAGEDVPLEPAGGKWTDAGVVLGPARAVAWRILDAQYFGLAQRRRRVFVVASAREGFDPAAVLLEWEGVRRDSAPSREAGQRATGSLTARAGRNLGQANDDVDGHKLITMAHGQGGAEIGFDRGPTLTCNHKAPILALSNDPATAICANEQRTYTNEGSVFQLRNVVAQPVTYDLFNVTAPINRQNRQPGDPWHTLARSNAEHAAVVQATAVGGHPTLAFTTKLHNTRSNQAGKLYEEYTVGLDRNSPPPALLTPMQVRRLTPRECERLQGFPDDYTAIPWRKKPASECPDGPRYKSLGNSWAVPVVRWIGRRIQAEINNATTKEENAI